jgi:hypothetical protein
MQTFPLPPLRSRDRRGAAARSCRAVGTGPLTIDAAQVTHVSQALLQLVISARRTSDTVRIVPSQALSKSRAWRDSPLS